MTNINKPQSTSKADNLDGLDIDELSKRAEDYIDDKEKKRRVVEKPNSKHIKRSLTVITFTAVIFTCVIVLLPESISSEKVRSELGALVSGAHISIQKYFLEKDQLPPQIPDRTSRMFVRYEVVNVDSNPPEYILRTQHKDVDLEFNSLKPES